VKAWLGERLVALDRHQLVHMLARALAGAIALRFDPSAADGLDATLELALRDPHGRPTARYAVRIAESRCAVRAGAAARAGARAEIGADDLIRLASGGVTWPELFSTGASS
jgi:hypothetical protein